MTNPYKRSVDYQLWRRSVSRAEAHAINPAINPRFQINASDKVATAGSCFAQHISRRISKIGFNYYCPENGSNLDEASLKKQNYGVFSARYGNIYTVHQLNQLYHEAVNGQEKYEKSWERQSFLFDPYRPNIFPDGFHTNEEVVAERAKHLEYVKDIFKNCDVFVFTLGLTEGWRSKVDGSVFPLAPGVVAGAFDKSKHEFHNFSIDEVRSELFSFLDSVRKINTAIRVLLTVSPVPLIATYEDRHVLSSTIYSKSVLRVAAQEAYDTFPFVDYFPSYEIITGSPTGGLYYEDDMREVNSLGVSHAMRCFLDAYTMEERKEPKPHISTDIQEESKKASQIICDEEEIEKSILSN